MSLNAWYSHITSYFTLLSTPHSSYHPSSLYPSPNFFLPSLPAPPYTNQMFSSWPIPPPPQAQLKPELPLPESTLPTEQASLVLHSLIRSHLFLGIPHPTPGTSTFRAISLTFDIPRHLTSSLIRAQILVYLIQPHKWSNYHGSNR